MSKTKILKGKSKSASAYDAGLLGGNAGASYAMTANRGKAPTKGKKCDTEANESEVTMYHARRGK